MSTILFLLACAAILIYGFIWHGSALVTGVLSLPREIRRRLARLRRNGGLRGLLGRIAGKMSR